MKHRLLTALVVACAILGGFTATLHFPAAEPRGSRQKAERAGTGALGSFEWWYGQRAEPGRLIPRGAFEKASRALRLASKYPPSRLSSIAAPPTQCKSIGPDNIGGRTLALAVDPSSHNTVWAGAASGGLWKSTTGGQGIGSWSYVSTGFPAVSVSAIVIDPSAPAVMYIGTGEVSLYQRGLI